MLNKEKKIKKILKKIYKNKIVVGHSNSSRNPKMAKFILFKNKQFDIINPFKILKYKKKAQKFLKECASIGGIILYVGTKKQIKFIVEKYAKKVKMPFINYKWPAGLLTNIKNTRLSIKKKNILETQKKTIYKYLSKKEKLFMNRKYDKINKKFGTIFNMNRLPMAIIIVDVKKEHIAVKEAFKTSIYTIGIVDTDSSPQYIDYPIPANDDLSKSINYILKGLTRSIIKGLKERKLNLKKEKNKLFLKKDEDKLNLKKDEDKLNLKKDEDKLNLKKDE
ncbi:MAG: 30S ribosomal protein S2 [Candidatus Shikimatogenerans bostrichidophilus]|nr:MAG: 30S ribosomal protein S2 [Candidatus Shikimatogenerans bostrichidophilus]